MTTCQIEAGVEQPYEAASPGEPQGLAFFLGAVRGISGARVAIVEQAHEGAEVHVYVSSLWAAEADRVWEAEAAVIRQFEGGPVVRLHGMKEEGLTAEAVAAALPDGAHFV